MLARLSCDGKGRVWAVNSAGQIYKKTLLAKAWERVTGSLSDISVGKNSVWGVNIHQQIYTRVGDEGNWKRVPGRLNQVWQ